jgi:hypothetical protein
MHLGDDLRRRAGLLLWAFTLLCACWLALRIGARPAVATTREQRVAAAFAKLDQAERRSPLVLLGDSISAGHTWSAGRGCRAPLNLAVSGAQSGDLLRNLRQVQAAGAESALVMIGINDLRHGVSYPRLLANYREILRGLQAQGVTPVLQSTLRVTPLHEQHQALNQQVARLNGQLRAWAQEQGWQYLDVQAALDGRSYRGDGLHLNAGGYRAWEQLLAPILRERLCGGSDQAGQLQQPPGQAQQLHQQAGEAQPDEQRAGADQVHQRLEQARAE